MYYRHFITTAVVIFFVLTVFSCKKDEETNPADNVEAMPFEKLSDYEFFEGEMKNLVPKDHCIPFDLNTPLFSDYAGKARFIYIPKGKQAEYNDHSAFDFPVGTLLVKTFYFDHDLRDPSAGRTIYETRLLVHKSSGWEGLTYLWNEDQTEADYYIAGKNVNVSWIHYDGGTRNTLYHIPNKNECKGCHNDSETIIPIGPKARNLNKDFPYPTGTMNQLDKWVAEGILGGTPAASAVPRVPVWNDPNSGPLNERARGYLDVNCAHCHNATGPANSSGLFLTYDETNPTALGVCKPPVAAGLGSGGRQYSIVPGKPDESIITYRMNSTQPDIAMPELARSVIHDEGVQLIADWIAAMPVGDCD